MNNRHKSKKSTYKLFIFFFFRLYKNGKKVLTFDKQCINKNAFHSNKRTISIVKVEIKRILLSKKRLTW